MKRTILALAIATIFGGAIQASTVISCNGSKVAVNSCISSNLANFQTQLDWAVFGTPDGSTHSGVWSASSGGLTIDVNTTGPGVMGARTADNYASLLVGGNWVLASNVVGAPYWVPNHFDAPPDTTGSGSALNPGNPGDHLMGLATNGTSTLGQLLLNFSTGQQSLGFRLASTSNSAFQATVEIFSGANQTGLLASQTFNLTGGGGNCATLYVTNSNPPAPCNDAPFVAFLNFSTNQIKSVRIATNDVDGFYLGNLELGVSQASVPEPTPLIFCGCGLALLIIGKRQWKRRSS